MPGCPCVETTLSSAPSFRPKNRGEAPSMLPIPPYLFTPSSPSPVAFLFPFLPSIHVGTPHHHRRLHRPGLHRRRLHHHRLCTFQGNQDLEFGRNWVHISHPADSLTIDDLNLCRCRIVVPTGVRGWESIWEIRLGNGSCQTVVVHSSPATDHWQPGDDAVDIQRSSDAELKAGHWMQSGSWSWRILVGV